MPLLNNRHVAALVALFALVPAAGRAQVSLFPKVESFEYPIASPRVAGIVGRVLSVRRGESRFGSEREAEARIGESIPVIGFSAAPVPVHLELELQISGRFSLDDSQSALISNDWVVGLGTVAQWPAVRLALGLYHESSHLGDEYGDRFEVPRLDWTREFGALSVRLGRGPLTAHVGGTYTLVNELDLPRGAASLGLDYRGRAGRALGVSVMPVAGLYAESVGYARWKVTTAARLGLELGAGNQRTGVSLIVLDGLSTQRQFFRERSRYAGFELRFDF